jgi:siroheme synthase-like protein
MNTLFPIFVKLDQIQILLVGGGNVGLEKLSAMLRNSPEANITIVADRILEDVWRLIENHPQVQVLHRKFEYADLQDKNLVILATDDYTLHQNIKKETERLGILTNVADTPELCDFYLGAIVQKGDLKIAISTNGKSPTLAKRLREYFEESIPEEEIQFLLDNLRNFRNTLKGDFQEKIKELNRVTASLVNSPI